MTEAIITAAMEMIKAIMENETAKINAITDPALKQQLAQNLLTIQKPFVDLVNTISSWFNSHANSSQKSSA